MSSSNVTGTLVKSCYASLDDGLPRKRDSVSTFCVFLQPSGIINHFYIPIHALATSNSAEKDFQLQSGLRDKLNEGVNDEDINTIVRDILEVNNYQLRSQILLEMISSNNISFELVHRVLDDIKNTFDFNDKVSFFKYCNIIFRTEYNQ